MTSKISRRTTLALLGAAATPAKAQTKGGVLRVTNPANPSSLDPITGSAGSDHQALYPLYSTLVEWDFDTLLAQPGIAESWEFPDLKTLVLHLRKGVTFHDGTPCDAEAVKFNLERAKNHQRSTIKSDMASMDTVEATAPEVVTIRMKQPNTAMPLILSDRAGMMVSPTAARAAPEGIDRKPVGAGPWKLVSWQDGAKLTYTRHDGFFKPGLPYCDGLDMTIIPELNTGLRSVITGENDLTPRVSPTQKAIIDRTKSLTGVMGTTLYFHMFFFNYARGPLADVRVRKAFNHAIDREALNKATMGGFAEIAITGLPKSHWAHAPGLDDLLAYDVARAKRLLQDAGLGDGFELKVAGYSDQTSQQRQEVLIEMLSKVGIRLKWGRGTVADMTVAFHTPEQNYDMQLAAWTGRPDPTQTYTFLFDEGGYYNVGRVQPVPELPAALLAAQSTTDQEQRKAAFARVQRLAVENALFCPLVFDPLIGAHSARVKNYRANLLGKPKYEDVWLA